jgi:hypothetical protein
VDGKTVWLEHFLMRTDSCTSVVTRISSGFPFVSSRIFNIMVSKLSVNFSVEVSITDK